MLISNKLDSIPVLNSKFNRSENRLKLKRFREERNWKRCKSKRRGMKMRI